MLKVLFLLLIPVILHAEVVERLEAVVNKKAIYLSDIERFRSLHGLRAKIDPLFAGSPMAKRANLTDEDIVQYLINEELIAQKYPVSEAEVEQEINSIQGNLKIGRDGLKQALRAEGYSFEDYSKLMRLSLAKRQLLEREIRSKAGVSEDDVRNEFNKSQFGNKSFQGSFHLYILKASKKNYKSPQAAKEQAQKAYDAIYAGETFETVAKSTSDDDSASNGGDLGFLSYSDLSPFLQKEVRQLNVGKTSQVLDEGSAYYLLKITEIKTDHDAGFENERNQIRNRMMEEQFQHQISLWIERQRGSNYIKRNKKS